MTTALDLFAGAGGWSVAAQRMGITDVGVEIMPAARATRVAAGFPTHSVHDVWDLVPGAENDYAGLIASPPCQTFSNAGTGTGRRALDQVTALVDDGSWRSLAQLRAAADRLGDERTALVLTPLYFATLLSPEWVALEQVPSVLPVWEAIGRVLSSLGYSVWTGILNSEEYGVPQTRRRAVLIASRRRAVHRPMPTHSRYHLRSPGTLDLGVAPWVSMAEAIGWGLVARPSYTLCGVTAHAVGDTEWGGESVRRALREARDSGDPTRWLATGTRPRAAMRSEHEPSPALAFGHDAASYVWVPAGSTPADVPSLKLSGEAVRITVAEAAVLQSFPADHPFQGKRRADPYLQIGNAIPPLMAEAVLRVATGRTQ